MTDNEDDEGEDHEEWKIIIYCFLMNAFQSVCDIWTHTTVYMYQLLQSKLGERATT